VGWSRVRDRAHWLSDVVIGGTVGAISGLAVGSTHPHRRWTVVAAPTDRGAAVYVVR